MSKKRDFENLTVYEIMWKNIVNSDSLQVTTWSKRIACWITKATDNVRSR